MPTDPLNLTLDETVSEIGRLVNHLERLTLLSAEDESDPERSINRLIDLNLAKATFTTAYKQYETVVAHDMERKPFVEMPGGFIVERKEGRPRKKWNHKKLGREVAHRIHDRSIDMDTGEILMSAEEMMTSMLQYAAPSYWRVTQLKKLGVDANNYCELGEGTVSVSIRKPKV